jgi:hypothetical protein
MRITIRTHTPFANEDRKETPQEKSERARQQMREIHANPEIVRARLERLRLYDHDPRIKKLRAANMRRLNADPEFAKAKSDAARKRMQELNAKRYGEKDKDSMSILLVGHRGVLGSMILSRNNEACLPWGGRLEVESMLPSNRTASAILCAGTKGYAENEGNRASFRADVDGNIRLAKHLLRQGTFVVFVSTDGVEWGAHTAYARNRLLVEMALIMQPNVAIVRPGKFDANNVGPLADLCIDVALRKREGLHYWRAQ